MMHCDGGMARAGYHYWTRKGRRINGKKELGAGSAFLYHGGRDEFCAQKKR